LNVIVFNRKTGAARQFDLTSPACAAGLAGALLLVLSVAFFAGGFIGAEWASARPAAQLASWARQLHDQQTELAGIRQTMRDKLDQLALRVGQMNADVLRLDALGRRLTSVAKLDQREFDGARNGAKAAPAEAAPVAAAAVMPGLDNELDRLGGELEARERQLVALEAALLTRNLNQSLLPQGKPVDDGAITSTYGERLDPITGRSSFHPGVDFAAPQGTNVVSVATGVVTWAGYHAEYGNLVEINHGNGYSTRYGHNERVLVKVGDTVQKGQRLALSGSTGRSTGPHVHFEVLRDGSVVNPWTFINRASHGSFVASR
jgi:murein DD-endopeptidase MepM/ murein hydrolase activator NlpD